MSRRSQATPDPYGHGITLTARDDGRLRVRWFDPPASRRSEHRRERTFTDPDAARAFAHELATGLSNHGGHALIRQARRTTPWAEVSQAWLDIKSANGDWSPSARSHCRRSTANDPRFWWLCGPWRPRQKTTILGGGMIAIAVSAVMSATATGSWWRTSSSGIG